LSEFGLAPRGHDQVRLEEFLEAVNYRGGSSIGRCDRRLESIHWLTGNFGNVEN